MADPRVVNWIAQAAAKTGADPAALLATSLTENGARAGLTPGDNGTSFGYFQMHQGGALGSHPARWAATPAVALNRAQEFARLQVHGGKGAAAVQRPADPAGYASKVQANLGEARRLLGSAAPAPTRQAVTQRQSIPALATTSQDHVGNALLQSILDSNARIAGIASIQLPTMPTIPTTPAPRAPAPSAVNPTQPLTPGTTKYTNPFAGAKVGQSRVDQGVDYTIHGPIRAIGDAKVVFKGNYQGFGNYVVYRIASGSHAGRHVYISEGISPNVQVGQTVKAGQPIARGTGGIETGWAQPGNGYLPMAKITGGYKEGQRTAAGDSFNRLMVSLGVVPGTTSGRPTIGRYA